MSPLKSYQPYKNNQLSKGYISLLFTTIIMQTLGGQLELLECTA